MSEILDLIAKMKKKTQEDATEGKRGVKPIRNIINSIKKAKKIIDAENKKKKEEKQKINITGLDLKGPVNIDGQIGARGGGYKSQPSKFANADAIGMDDIIPPVNQKKTKNKKQISIEEETRKKEDITSVNESYPLKSRYIAEFSSITAFCNIKFNKKENALIYNVLEPPLLPKDAMQINKIKKYFEETITIHYEGAKTNTAIEFIKKTLEECIKKFGLNFSKEKLDLYRYYLFRDFIGLEKLDPILNDSEIEDISCDGVNIPVFIFHKNPKYGSIQTNIIFKTKTELDDFVMKVAQRCGKTVSIANPYFDGALPDKTRVQATLSTDIAPRGSNFTMRKFKKDPITPTFLLKYKSLNAYSLAYLWFLIEYNTSILVVGATASGKTSFLNALSLFIPECQKIISIEDTPEIQLSHPNWIAEVSRQGFETIAGQQKKTGEVSMNDLLKEALRQRPDYIIVGEVRGEEAIVLFQAMATGHSGLATIHADNMQRLIDRITSRPISIPSALLETLDMIIFVKRLRYKNTFVRRVSEIYEIEGYDRQNKEIISRKVFEWNAQKDELEPKQSSILLGNAYSRKGIAKEVITEEIKKRAKVLNYMKDKNITHYRDVSKIIRKYYLDSNALIEQINAVEENEKY